MYTVTIYFKDELKKNLKKTMFKFEPLVTFFAGGLEPIPAVIGREAGYTLDRSPVYHRATQRQTRQTTTHTHSKRPF